MSIYVPFASSVNLPGCGHLGRERYLTILRQLSDEVFTFKFALDGLTCNLFLQLIVFEIPHVALFVQTPQNGIE